MSKKSYDQRLKERWLRKQRKQDAECDASMSEFRRMGEMAKSIAFVLPILPTLFRKRNR